MKGASFKFWNSPKIIDEFKYAHPQRYWLKIFNQLKRKNLKVLDMGCGGGRYTEVFAKLGFSIVAFDLYEGMLKATRARLQNYPDIQIVKADMVGLPFKSNEFDIAFSNGLFHNSKNLRHFMKILSETSRVIKTYGLLCLNMFYDSGKNSKIKKISGKVFETDVGLLMLLLEKHELLEILNNFGFEPVGKVYTYDRNLEVGVRSVLRGVFKKSLVNS